MRSKEALKRLAERDYLTQREHNEFLNLVKQDFYRLERLEAIEEELGIDLITLFKALKDGIYVIEENDNYIVEDNIRSIENWKDGWGITTNMENLEFFFSDYGKTWALTREELEE